jgi:hypothetical protein
LFFTLHPLTFNLRHSLFTIQKMVGHPAAEPKTGADGGGGGGGGAGKAQGKATSKALSNPSEDWVKSNVMPCNPAAPTTLSTAKVVTS